MARKTFKALPKRKENSSLSWSLEEIHQNLHKGKVSFPRRAWPNPTHCSLIISWWRTRTSLHLAQDHFIRYILGRPSGPVCCYHNNSSIIFWRRNNRSTFLRSSYWLSQHTKGKSLCVFGWSQRKNEANFWCIWKIFGLSLVTRILDNRTERMVELNQNQLRSNILWPVKTLLWLWELACLVHSIIEIVGHSVRY